jgi:phosphoribosylamine-glycine ligase
MDGKDIELKFKDEKAVCLVMCSGGYPRNIETGFEIVGEDKVKHSKLLYAGAIRKGDKVVSNGGRVLNIVATGATLKMPAKSLRRCKSCTFRLRLLQRRHRKVLIKITKKIWSHSKSFCKTVNIRNKSSDYQTSDQKSDKFLKSYNLSSIKSIIKNEQRYYYFRFRIPVQPAYRKKNP